MAYKITQKAIPLWNPTLSNGCYTKGRSSLNHVPIAIVNHRMVGYLTGTDRHFANPDSQTSAHFGIGTRVAGGPVEISQYVDLADSAFANGNYDSTGGWPLIKRLASGAIDNPNYYTVSIEHQDGSEAGRGIVTDEIKAASLWLQRILLTGDMNLYAKVGIKCSSQRVADGLKALVPGAETIIDHNRISGRLKPYCWRVWLDDAGFLPWKTKLIASLQDTMPTLDEILALLNAEIDRIELERDNANGKLVTANQTITTLTTARDTLQAKLTTAKAKAAEIASL